MAPEFVDSKDELTPDTSVLIPYRNSRSFGFILENLPNGWSLEFQTGSGIDDFLATLLKHASPVPVKDKIRPKKGVLLQQIASAINNQQDSRLKPGERKLRFTNTELPGVSTLATSHDFSVLRFRFAGQEVVQQAAMLLLPHAHNMPKEVEGLRGILTFTRLLDRRSLSELARLVPLTHSDPYHIMTPYEVIQEVKREFLAKAA